jgi:sec-independent protein translocase protein TatC
VLAIAIAAMLLPGTDPVTMILAMAPLYALFELSLVLTRAFGHPPGELADETELRGSDAPAQGAP